MNYRLFQIGGVNIYTYGTMVAIAFLTGIFLGVYRAKKLGENPQNILDLCLYIMIGSIAGARLVFVMNNWEYFRNNLIEILFIQQGGLVFYGGMIAAVLIAIIYLKLKHLSILLYLDILTPSLAIGHAIGRIGCFFNGCCYGKVPESGSLFGFLAVRFPRIVDKIMVTPEHFSEQVIGSPPYVDHLYKGLITDEAVCSLPVYPTQLFSAAMNFAFFVIVTYMFRTRKFNGQIWWSYLIMYAVGRFLIECIRGDVPRIEPTPFTFSQLISIAMFAVGIIMYHILRIQAEKRAR